MKTEYSAYLHINGKIEVKRCVFGQDLHDYSSPFVKKALGTVTANSYDEACSKFEENLDWRLNHDKLNPNTRRNI